VTDTNARLKQRLDRIAFRAWRRGFREADMVLGPFADQVGPTLDARELDDFEALLGQDDDHELYAWIIESRETPETYETDVMRKIRAFMRAHVAHAVAEGIG